jgi:molybdopterin converting factor small subunit
MKVHLEFLSLPMVSKIVGNNKLDIDISGQTVKDVIEELIRHYGEKISDAFYDPRRNFDLNIQIAINGKSFISTDKHNTPLNEGDHLTFMLLLAGG